MKMSTNEELMVAATTDMVGRTGASDMQIRWSDDVMPVIWIAVAVFQPGTRTPAGVIDRVGYQCAAGPTPSEACWQLVRLLVHGGICQHCGHRTDVTRDFTHRPDTPDVCWYRYDPELHRFRRSCEGVHDHEKCEHR